MGPYLFTRFLFYLYLLFVVFFVFFFCCRKKIKIGLKTKGNLRKTGMVRLAFKAYSFDRRIRAIR
jgi:hypothetical protein